MFFSVVIPTRNRPAMASAAITSVLRQDFSDFEVIVSDNSDTKRSEELKAAVEGIVDGRVRYVRPNHEMSMGEHWQFASDHVCGEYVGYLTDRMVFRRDALTYLSREIAGSRPDVISYSSSGVLEDVPPFRLQRPPFTCRAETYESQWVVKLLSLSVPPWGAPCMLNSFIRRDLLEEMKGLYGAFMTSAAPDIAFCMHVLDKVDRFTYLDQPLMISYGSAASNGAALGTGRLNEFSLDFASRLDRQGGLPYAPIPEIVNNHNIRTNEYCRMRARQRSGRFVELDLTAYCDELTAELFLQGERARSEDWQRLEQFMQAHGISTRRVVRHGSRLKRGLNPLLQAASDWLSINPVNLAVGRFANVSEALAYDESHVPRPNSRHSGFLRARDRAKLAAAGFNPLPSESPKP